ncbi:hypothetical protein [Kribbella endophytica]
MSSMPEPGIELYWLPLGAGGRSVRWNGRVLNEGDLTAALGWVLAHSPPRGV